MSKDAARSETRRKVAAAFSELRSEHGISARMRFTCCRICASQSVDRKINLSFRQEEIPSRWVYFTARDDRDAAATGILAVSYGDVRLQNAARLYDRAVGRLAMEALRRAGLEPEWDDDPSRRIYVPVDPWFLQNWRK